MTTATVLVRALAVVVASLPAARALDDGPEPPTSSRHAARKDARSDESPAGPVATLATLVNVHTHEIVPLAPDEPPAAAFDAFVHDRVTGARASIDPRVLALLRTLAASRPAARVEIVSGFRSPKLNEMLRKKGHKVASHSQHSLGHALDFRFVGTSPRDLERAIEKTGWQGGLGRYDAATDDFVHADVGPRRSWRGK